MANRAESSECWLPSGKLGVVALSCELGPIVQPLHMHPGKDLQIANRSALHEAL